MPFLCQLMLLLLRLPIFIVAVMLYSDKTQAQNEYWVFFKDKASYSFDTFTELSAKTIERRILSGFPAVDITDLPVNEGYINQILQIADTADVASRWLNAITVWAGDDAIQKIRELPFVIDVKPISNPDLQLMESIDNDDERELRNLAHVQLSLFVPQNIGNRGLNGKGVRIAVIDAGFPAVNKHKAFDALNSRKGIIAQRDFVKDKDGPMGGHKHGMQVLSNICGMYENMPLGFGTGAEFLLARTEKAVGFFTSGEKYWWEAVEWAEKNGAQIISTSLGYGKERYFEEDMDGLHTSVSMAARMAAARGILVVAAAGNEGVNGNWLTLVSPADADSVLAVGGIDPATGLVSDFGSRGLQLGNKVKPNVSAPAITVTANRNDAYTQNMGTSFAAPLVAGLAACYWQAYPSFTNMQVLDAIEKAGHLYPYYDLAHGYGVPLATKLFSDGTEPLPTFEVHEKDSIISIKINGETNSAVNPYLGMDMLYYHLENEEGRMLKYAVIKVFSNEPLRLNLRKMRENEQNPVILRTHFRGYSYTYTIRYAEVPEK